MPNTITPRIHEAIQELTEAIDEHIPTLRESAKADQGGREVMSMLGTIKRNTKETLRLTSGQDND